MSEEGRTAYLDSLHSTSWLDDYENIHTLARFLAEEKGFSMDNILYFLEKRWHYTNEYNEMVEYRKKEDG